MKFWLQIQKFLDIKSGAVLGLMSFNMIGLVWYCHLTGKPLQSEAVVLALGMIAGKTVHGMTTKRGSNAKD